MVCATASSASRHQSDLRVQEDDAAIGRALVKIISRKGRRASAIRALLLAELQSEPELEALFDLNEVVLDC